jgi:hypothetical protein
LLTVFGRWSVIRQVVCWMLAQTGCHARSNVARCACFSGPGAKLTKAKL